MDKNIEKFEKEYPEFVSEAQSLDDSQLDARLAQLAKDGAAVDEAKEADEGLTQAREALSQLSAPYRDSKKAIKLKVKYIISILEARGKE